MRRPTVKSADMTTGVAKFYKEVVNGSANARICHARQESEWSKSAHRRQRDRGRAAGARRQRVRLDRRRSDQLRSPRRLRRCRRDDDRHRRRLFGLGARASRRRERDGDRPLAEARSGQARQGRDRDQGRLSRRRNRRRRICRRARAEGHRPRLRRLAAAARDRHASTSITSTRTTRRAAGRQPRRVRRAARSAGKIRAIGLSQFTADAARRSDRRPRERDGFAAPAALQTWYNLVERAKLEGDAARRRACATASASSLLQPRQRLPDRQVPKQGRPRQKPARAAHRELSRGQGDARARRARRGRGGDRRGAGDDLARLDSWPSRRSPRRSPARPASTS